MNLNDIFSISHSKVEALKAKLARLGIDLKNIEEQFVRGGGKGGQKVNKTSNAVILRYSPLGLVVRAHRERQRSINRFLALRELADRVEMMISPETSARLQNQKRGKKQKDRRRRRQSQPSLKISSGGNAGL